MPFGRWSHPTARLVWLGRRAGARRRAQATPYLVVDADSDQVLMENEATAPWYPASLTKLMTVYVALDAVRNGKLTLDTPLVMSARAARMPPSKMGFRPGTQVTLDNALKMLMVKSPNDVAVMVAEGVSGSVEAFADDMNADAQRLGMHESHFVNPNGLHNPAHVSSARDMAIIARALLREFPRPCRPLQHRRDSTRQPLHPQPQWPAWPLSRRRWDEDGLHLPGGFQCGGERQPSGRRLIVVVLGAPSARSRNQEAADLFDRGFASGGGSGSLESLPVGLRRSAQHARRRLPASQRRRDRRRRRRRRSPTRPRQPDRLAAGCAPDALGGAFRPGRSSHRAPGRKDPFRSGARLHWSGARAGRAGAGRSPDDNGTAAASAAPRPCPLTTPPPSRRRRKATQARPSRLRPNPSSSMSRHAEKSMAAHKPAKSAAEKAGEERRIHRLNLRWRAFAQGW